MTLRPASSSKLLPLVCRILGFGFMAEAVAIAVSPSHQIRQIWRARKALRSCAGHVSLGVEVFAIHPDGEISAYYPYVNQILVYAKDGTITSREELVGDTKEEFDEIDEFMNEINIQLLS